MLGFFAGLAIMANAFDIWGELIELAFAGAFIFLAFMDLKAAGC